MHRHSLMRRHSRLQMLLILSDDVGVKSSNCALTTKRHYERNIFQSDNKAGDKQDSMGGRWDFSVRLRDQLFYFSHKTKCRRYNGILSADKDAADGLCGT